MSVSQSSRKSSCRGGRAPGLRRHRLHLGAPFLKTLKQAGIKGKVFNPLAALPSFIFNNRNHRKIVVIDSEIAYTGGTSLADDTSI